MIYIHKHIVTMSPHDTETKEKADKIAASLEKLGIFSKRSEDTTGITIEWTERIKA